MNSIPNSRRASRVPFLDQTRFRKEWEWNCFIGGEGLQADMWDDKEIQGWLDSHKLWADEQERAFQERVRRLDEQNQTWEIF